MAGPTAYFNPANASSLDASTRALVDRRARVLGPAYRLFSEHPVQFVRGSGTKLWDAEGHEYLDVYNNVPSVGHSHPRVVAAIAEQAATLNTHTRYLQEGILDYSEDLLGTLEKVMDAGYFKNHDRRVLALMIFGMLSESSRSFELAKDVKIARESVGTTFVNFMEAARA